MKRPCLLLFFIGILTLCVFFVDCTSGIGPTLHSGSTSGDETWRANDNPHIIASDFTVSMEDTLTIEPGCNVRVNAAVNMRVEGTLLATGTQGNEILFEANEGDPDVGWLWWGNIEITQSSGNGSIVDYCEIMQGYGIEIYGSSPTISNNSIHNMRDAGIRIESASPLIINNDIENCGFAGIYLAYSSPEIVSNRISGNDMYGITCESPDCEGNITQNIIENNFHYGILAYGFVRIFENSFTNNGGWEGYGGAINCGDHCIAMNNEISNSFCTGILAKQNSVVANNEISNPGSYGILARKFDENPCNVKISNNLIQNSQGEGFHVDGGATPLITDCIIVGSTDFDFYLDDDSHPLVINTSFDESSVYFDDDLSTLRKGWYLTVKVRDISGDSLAGAKVLVENSFGNSTTFRTDSDGYVRNIICFEMESFDKNGDTEPDNEKKYYTPHMIKVKKDCGEDEKKIHMSDNKEVKFSLETREFIKTPFGMAIIAATIIGGCVVIIVLRKNTWRNVIDATCYEENTISTAKIVKESISDSNEVDCCE